ncbi:MAG: TerB family tellurite resistance protein [Hydrocarboniphaga sp.]|uniref:tellurite resistance TerB family protein n=1 Tax=Hydrocarboniphaga sp. TaxID=2033016 RepID=UPI0026036A05|nr:TerB family tellurite resistance protein [Hydrocarboniphaga sp.]MDB5969416.1 TerB family tellurite resistance protein [Hydrocarboniphaga sp.]
MWQKLLRHFESPPVDEAARQRLAVAVLLLECARADFERSENEMLAVRDALRRYLSLDDAALDRLLAEAGEQARQAVSLHEFVQRLNASMQPPDKIELISMLWRVAYADGRLDVHEEHLLRRLADLLYIPHQDFIATKLKAEAQMPNG